MLTMQLLKPENVVIPQVWDTFCIFDDAAGIAVLRLLGVHNAEVASISENATKTN